MILLLKLAQNAALTNGDCNSRAVLESRLTLLSKTANTLDRFCFLKHMRLHFSVMSHAKKGLGVLGGCTWALPITPWETKLG